MKKDFSTIKIFFLSIVLPLSGTLYARDEIDCPLVIPEFDDTPLLTREERIQMMDQVLKDALGQVQNCRHTPANIEKSNTAPGSAASDIAGSSMGANIAQHKDDTKVEQAAIDDTGNGRNVTKNTRAARPDNELSGAEISQRTSSTPDGKLPEDIPPADNDNIVARQIREAASSEADPQKQAKLWNEYRRYKGLPEK